MSQPYLMYSESQAFTVNQIWLTGLQMNSQNTISWDLACLHTFISVDTYEIGMKRQYNLISGTNAWPTTV